MTALRTILLIVLFAATVAGQAGARQVDVFEHVSVGDGLAHPKVNGLLQDASGFVWIATGGGLDRFDGIRIRHVPLGTKGGGRTRTVGPLLSLATGGVLAATESGVYAIDPQSLESRYYAHEFPEGGAPVAMALGPDGGVWIAAWTDGLHRLDLTSGTFERVLSDSIQVLDVLTAPDGVIWVATASGLGRIAHGESMPVFFVHDPGDSGSIRSDRTRRLAWMNGQLWVGTEAGLDVMHPFESRFIRVPLGRFTDNMMSALAPGRQGVLWIGLEDALLGYDTADASVQAFTHDPRAEGSLASGRIGQILVTDSGSLVVGSDRSGVSMSALQGAGIRRHTEVGDATRVPLGLIGSFCEVQAHQIMIGGSDGLYMYDEAAGRIRLMVETSRLTGGAFINTLLKTRSGAVWMGTEGSGFGPLDTVSLTFSPISLSGRDASFVYSMAEDADGTIWVGTFGGLLNVSPDGRILAHFRQDDGSGLPSNWVSQLIDGDGQLFLATNLGLTILDTESGTFEHIGFGENLRFRNAGIVTGMVVSSAGTVSMSTSGAGLVTIDLASRTAVNHDTEPELSAVVEDASGRLWLQSPSGFIHLDPRTGVQVKQAADVGIMPHDIAVGAFLASSGGDLLFGTQKGFFVLSPDRLTTQRRIPGVRLSAVAAAGTQRKVDSGRVVGAIDASSMPVVFQFAPDTYPAARDVSLMYRLTPVDTSWTKLEQPGDITFSSLPTGRLVLEAAYRSTDGRMSEASSTVFISRPYWFRSWWFTLLATLSVLVLGAGTVLARVRKVRQDNARLETLVAERTARLEDQQVLLSQKNDQLAELDSMKSRFFINISHDFRTPLTLILGPLEDLIEHSEGESKVSLQRALRNGQRLLRLINQVMDLARLEAGALKLDVQPTDIRDLARKTLGAFESVGRMREISISVAGGDRPVVAGVDPAQLEVILLNLLSNAFKHTAPGGTVTIDVRPDEGGYVVISVKDTGIGIPEEHIPFLFDRFYQVRSSFGDVVPGSGVGLALVKELVELHGGTIAVSSQVGDDSGTTFTVSLPSLSIEKAIASPGIVRVDTFEFEEGSGRAPVLPGGDKEWPSVLIVEDHPDLRAYVREHLEEQYDVLEAEDGTVGLDRAIETVPDLIISDIMMPRMDGLAMLRAIRADMRTSHIPVILLTARADVESNIEGMNTGADAFVPKPFNARVLKAQIASMLERRARMWDAFRSGDDETPDGPVVSELEQKLMDDIESFVESSIHDPQFSVDQLALHCGMSSRQLSRKLAVVLNQSPGAYIRTRRLQRAAVLLTDAEASVKEVSFLVGFRSETHFSKQFKEEYGVPPGGWSKR